MRGQGIGAILGIAFSVAPIAGQAQELADLLSKGPVVLVESEDNGKFKQATAVVDIDRPIDQVWAVATDLGHAKDFMPRVVKSVAKEAPRPADAPAGSRVLDVKYEVDTPGSNTVYTYRFVIDDANHQMVGTWLKGDLKGSHCAWKLVAMQDRTRAFYSVATKNFSALAEKLEDDQQTLTVGVNVSAAMATAKAVKRRAESPPSK